MHHSDATKKTEACTIGQGFSRVQSFSVRRAFFKGICTRLILTRSWNAVKKPLLGHTRPTRTHVRLVLSVHADAKTSLGSLNHMRPDCKRRRGRLVSKIYQRSIGIDTSWTGCGGNVRKIKHRNFQFIKISIG